MPLNVFPLPTDVNYDYEDAFTSKHKGTDIFAARGTPVLAVDAGIARVAEDPRGGHVVYLRAADDWRYYYAHLDSFDPVLEAAGKLGMQVAEGTPLGFLGSSGNAAGKSPHLHFQMSKEDVTADPFDSLAAVDLRGNPPVLKPSPPETEPAEPETAPEPSPAPLATVPKEETITAKEAGGGGLLLALLAFWWFSKRRKRT